MALGADISLNDTTGTRIGTATDQLLGFFGQTAIAQPAAADQVAVSLAADFPADGSASISGATDLEAACDTIRSLTTAVNGMRTVLVNLGLMKGAAP